MTEKRSETEIARDIHEELAVLPKQFGFSSVGHFLRAVRKAASGGGKKHGRKKARKTAAPRLRKRAKITNATRAKVKKLVKAGKTGGQIAKAVGISLPSVQNIKKALGLVRTAKKSTPKSKTHRTKATLKVAPKRRKKRSAPKKVSAPEVTLPPVPIESLIPPA